MEKLTIYVLETIPIVKTKVLMELLKELVKTMHASEQTANTLTNVMYQLAETDPDTCNWVLDNFYDLEDYLNLIEKILNFSTQKLIDKGFIPGKDFSANPGGGIIIKRKAMVGLMEEAAAFDRLLLEDILQVLD